MTRQAVLFQSDQSLPTLDPDRGEMMLRPDYTVPVVQMHMRQGAEPARYMRRWSGPCNAARPFPRGGIRDMPQGHTQKRTRSPPGCPENSPPETGHKLVYFSF